MIDKARNTVMQWSFKWVRTYRSALTPWQWIKNPDAYYQPNLRTPANPIGSQAAPHYFYRKDSKSNKAPRRRLRGIISALQTAGFSTSLRFKERSYQFHVDRSDGFYPVVSEILGKRDF